MLYGEGAHNAQDKFFSGYLQRFNKLVPSLLILSSDKPYVTPVARHSLLTPGDMRKVGLPKT